MTFYSAKYLAGLYGKIKEKLFRTSLNHSSPPPLGTHSQAEKHRGDAYLAEGKLEEAATCYRKVLANAANDANIWLNLGYVYSEQKRYLDAKNHLVHALSLNPRAADAWFILGAVAEAENKIDEAIENYCKVIEINPEFESVYLNLIKALIRVDRISEAKATAIEGIALHPGIADFHLYLGNIFVHEKNNTEAEVSFLKALALKPNYPEAYNNLGLLYKEEGRLEEAVKAYEEALRIFPNYAEVHYNCGIAQMQNKSYESALSSYNCAIALHLNCPDLYNNRGWVLCCLRRYEEAIASFDHALQLDPQRAGAHNNRGVALGRLNQFQEALACYDKAIQIEPEYADAISNRGMALAALKRHTEAAQAFRNLVTIAPSYDYAIGFLLTEQLYSNDWSDYLKQCENIVSAIRAGKRAINPFSFLAISESEADSLQCSRIYLNQHFAESPESLSVGQHYDHTKIRIAYLSADFHDHATVFLMAELFELHDRDAFSITAVSFGPDSSGPMRKRIQGCFDQFLEVRNLSDYAVAKHLRQLEIDIVIDLKGFTTDSRPGILAYRPAPIQVNYLGYPGSMGAEYIDYIIADKHVIPPEHKEYFVEKVVWMPDSYQVNDSKRHIANWQPNRDQLDLPERGFVYCCFNNNYKITPQVFDVWMRLLKSVEDSVLWLLEDNASASKNLIKEAGLRGIPPHRLVFAPRIDLDKHLARHRFADLFLDTLPCNAHTTASDALWAGLPVLTCMGPTFAGRVAASLLHAIGLSDMVTESMGEYERVAIQLAKSPGKLATVRAKLLTNRETMPLFNADLFRKNIESAYRTMVNMHQEKQAPASFSVSISD